MLARTQQTKLTKSKTATKAKATVQTKMAEAAQADAEIPDARLLTVIARWRINREECRLRWAQQEGDTLFHLKKEDSEFTTPSCEIESGMRHLNEIEMISRQWEVKSIGGVVELLRMVKEILEAQEAKDPIGGFDTGDVVAMMRRVIEDLGYMDPEMLLRTSDDREH